MTILSSKLPTVNNNLTAQPATSGIASMTGTAQPTTSSVFTIPTNLFPTTTSNQTSSSSSHGWSGINWKSPLGKAMLPNLITAGQNLPGIVNQMGDTLQGQYSNLMRQALEPQNFQGVLNQLANRGMLNSTVAENTLGNAAKGIAQEIANQAFQSQLAQQQAQMQVPSILAGLTQLAQESESSGGSSSSSTSQSSNPLAPYELMASLLKYYP